MKPPNYQLDVVLTACWLVIKRQMVRSYPEPDPIQKFQRKILFYGGILPKGHVNQIPKNFFKLLNFKERLSILPLQSIEKVDRSSRIKNLTLFSIG